jgi:hypothetical protein
LDIFLSSILSVRFFDHPLALLKAEKEERTEKWRTEKCLWRLAPGQERAKTESSGGVESSGKLRSKKPYKPKKSKSEQRGFNTYPKEQISAILCWSGFVGFSRLSANEAAG